MEFVCIFPYRELLSELVESSEIYTDSRYSFLFIWNWADFFSESGVDFTSSIIWKLVPVCTYYVDPAYIALIL